MKVIGTDKNENEIAEVSVTELDTMFKEIRAKAIDEFAERIKEVYPFTILELEQLNEIAEEMRGVKNE